MPTKKPRLNITIDSSEAHLLSLLAKQRNKSVSSVAKELIVEALERCEDMALSTLAEVRLKEVDKAKKKTISHKDAWK